MLTERHKAMSEIADDLEVKGFPNLSLHVLRKIIKELTVEFPQEFAFLVSAYTKENIIAGIESYRLNGPTQKILGIKQLRAATNLGLRESKELYEAIGSAWKE